MHHAIERYLTKPSQSVWTNNHLDLDYTNQDRWGHDCSFVNSRWIDGANEVKELLFHETVRASCGAFSVNSLKGNDSETRRFRDRLTLQGSKPQRTTESEPFHKRVQELMDRHLHTHGFKYIDPSEHGNPPDIWDFWRKQVDEMNELCRLNGEPWAWEYLWKKWYSPRR